MRPEMRVLGTVLYNVQSISIDRHTSKGSRHCIPAIRDSYTPCYRPLDLAVDPS
jgi:hypothetical protein